MDRPDEKIKQHIPQAVVVYCNLIRSVYKDVPIIAGGIEAAASVDGYQPHACDGGGGEEESGGGDSGCLQRNGAAVGCGGQRRDIQHHSAEKEKMAE